MPWTESKALLDQKKLLRGKTFDATAKNCFNQHSTCGDQSECPDVLDFFHFILHVAPQVFYWVHTVYELFRAGQELPLCFSKKFRNLSRSVRWFSTLPLCMNRLQKSYTSPCVHLTFSEAPKIRQKQYLAPIICPSTANFDYRSYFRIFFLKSMKIAMHF